MSEITIPTLGEAEHTAIFKGVSQLNIRDGVTDNFIVYRKHVSIHNNIVRTLERVAEAKKRHREEIAKILENVHTLRKGCRHPCTVHRRDPSGGNDSDYQCVACGQIFDRSPGGYDG